MLDTGKPLLFNRCNNLPITEQTGSRIAVIGIDAKYVGHQTLLACIRRQDLAKYSLPLYVPCPLSWRGQTGGRLTILL